MVRLPASAKTELKKGPWTLEEDQILINHVQQYGHPNWRQLPKQAGLLRCGKSCRLRWINYLQPDIKRGNFTRDEEETIIKLHKVLGNRWSAIASKLPGRTDNEIKNVWHTHIKKKLTAKENQLQPMQEISSINVDDLSIFDQIFSDKSSEALDPVVPRPQEPSDSLSNSLLVSPQRICSFDMPSDCVTGGSIAGDNSTSQTVESQGNFREVDESFWSEVMSENNNNNSDASCDFQAGESWDMQLPFPLSPLSYELETIHAGGAQTSANVYEDVDDFWFDLYIRASNNMSEFSSM